MVPTVAQHERRRVFTPARETLLDLAVALVAFGLSLALLASGNVSGADDTRGFDALGAILVAAASLPLLARRRAPLAVFAATATASAALNAFDYPPGPPIGPTVALFFLGLAPATTRAGRRLTGATVGVLFAVHVTAAGIGHDEAPVVPALFGALVWGGAWVIGDRLRLRRLRVAELEARARRAEEDAERERRLAVAEERARIARDLHDSAGHAINVILVQAGAARLLGEKDPLRARAALETIEDVARETVGEIDRLVHALRDEEPPAAPIGLAALSTLIDRQRAIGLDVDVRVRGDTRPLPRAVDQAAYRIVQEALTNAGRHGGSTAELELAYEPRRLALTVTNPIRRGETPRPPGHGLVGMRERAALLGGRVETAMTDGTFRVRVLLPYGGRP